MVIRKLNKIRNLNKRTSALLFIILTLFCNLPFIETNAVINRPKEIQKAQIKMNSIVQTSSSKKLSGQNTPSNVSFSEVLGSNEFSHANDVAFDSSGNMYITGTTNSSNFPIVNAYQSKIAGDFDAFVVKINNLGELVMSTYFGGSAYDSGSSIKIDSTGNFVIMGVTFSSNLPTKNAYQPNNKGQEDIFVTKFNSLGQLLFSTYLGGSSYDYGSSIAINSAGTIILSGVTQSSDFPSLNPLKLPFSTSNFLPEAIIAKFNSTGSLIFSSLLAGNDSTEYDWATSVAIDTSNNYYVAGLTTSQTFPIKNDSSTRGMNRLVEYFELFG